MLQAGATGGSGEASGVSGSLLLRRADVEKWSTRPMSEWLGERGLKKSGTRDSLFNQICSSMEQPSRLILYDNSKLKIVLCNL